MTTNQRLRRLMDERGLTRQEVAVLLGASVHTVDSWLTESTGKSRNMPAAKLELLEMKLAARAAGGDHE